MTDSELPASILHYVIRTKQSVLLDDAQSPNQFSADEYFGKRRCRSVFCLPLIKQAELTGLLYLENTLTAHVFTPARIAILNLLASTAALSVENASLEENEALLKEVHHRVKNNLQLISSLLNLQAARIVDPAVAELFADSRNRVRSMALVHENLYRAGSFSRIPMAAHIQNLCSHLSRAYGLHADHVELTIQVSDLQLEMDRAVTCGLIINELVSNALKHAFPEGKRGNLRIELRPLTQMPKETRNVLIVSDDGIGLPSELDFGRIDSLGLQLVHDLTDQLLGTMTVNRDHGTTFTITFDADSRGERDR